MATSISSLIERPADESAPARPRLGPGQLVVAVIGPSAALYMSLKGGGWVFDDNLSLELARHDGLNWHWLTSKLFGHFEIADRAVFSLQRDWEGHQGREWEQRLELGLSRIARPRDACSGGPTTACFFTR